jgi:hypothetical protein
VPEDSPVAPQRAVARPLPLVRVEGRPWFHLSSDRLSLVKDEDALVRRRRQQLRRSSRVRSGWLERRGRRSAHSRSCSCSGSVPACRSLESEFKGCLIPPGEFEEQFRRPAGRHVLVQRAAEGASARRSPLLTAAGTNAGFTAARRARRRVRLPWHRPRTSRRSVLIVRLDQLFAGAPSTTPRETRCRCAEFL